MNIRWILGIAAIPAIAVGLTFSSNPAKAVLVGTLDMAFVVFNCPGGCGDFEANLSVDVDTTSGTISFTLTNTSTLTAANSGIDQFNLEAGWGTYLDSFTSGSEGSEVNFEETSITGVGTPVGWDGSFSQFRATNDEGFDAPDASPGNETPVNVLEAVNEFVTLNYALIGGGAALAGAFPNLAALELAMFTGALQGIIHVRACGDDQFGESTSCRAFATPIPPAILLFGSALLGLAGFGARRRRRAVA